MATYYIDPIAGDDAETGTNIAAPCRSLGRAYSLASGNDTFMLAGSCYHLGGNQLDGLASAGRSWISSGGAIAKANLTIDTYDAGYGTDRAVLDGRAYSQPGEGGWTHIGGGVWRLTASGATAAAYRVWVGASVTGKLLAQRSIGTAMARASQPTPSAVGTYYTTEAQVIDALSSLRIWYSADNGGEFASYPYAIYVYTGSESVDPPTYYGGLAWVQSGVSAEGLYTRNGGNDLRAQNIVIRGCAGVYGVGAGNNTTGNVDGALFANVRIDCYGKRGLRVHSGATYTSSNVVFSRCTVDACTDENEEPDDDDEWYAAFDDCADTGINTLWDRTVIRPHRRTHCALNIGYNGSASIVAQNVRVEDCRVVMPAQARDARAISIQYATGTTIRRSSFEGTASKNQLQGKNTIIDSCYFSASTNGYANDEDEQSNGVVAIESYVTTYQVEAVLFTNCTFDARNWTTSACAVALIRWNADAAHDFDGEVSFVNCAALLRTDQSFFGALATTSPAGDPPSEPTWGGNRAQTFTSNIAIGSPDNGEKCAAIANAAWYARDAGKWFAYAAMTAGIANADTGASTGSGRPRPGSPLLTGGADIGYLRDIEGKQSKGHIGAYGAARLRSV